MLMTERKPASVGEVLVEKFLKPMGLTKTALAAAMDVSRSQVNALCNSPEFWLNVQRRNDLWDALHSERERARIERARPLTDAA